MRLGFGFDAHNLMNGRPLRLGGVSIDFPMGLKGHSDGDVVLHALSDAILGSCAAGDIGMFFPDDDPNNKDIDSRKILESSIGKAAEHGYRVENIDIVIVADRPKLNGVYDQIRSSISLSCKVEPARVSVKAKTTEGTVIGKSAIGCFAIVLMDEK